MAKFIPSLILLLLLLNGCSSILYYGQAVSGHISLMAGRQPIQQMIDDEQVSRELKDRLLLVQSIRDYASDSLKLPDNSSYRSFVPVAGDAVVWSLVATEAFSVDPKQWCYPMIGCASYRGYFDLEDAQRHRLKLEAEGMDVALEPVPAYSTLGWFDDPLPGTVIGWTDWRLAGLIFHELAHQRLYISDDSSFNESFANKVQQVGVERWLAATQNAGKLDAWRLSQQRERAFVQLLMDTRVRLKALYALPLGNSEMKRGKDAAFNRLRVDYQSLKRNWQDYNGYDAWFVRKLNNARLASVATYEEWTQAFDQLFEQAGGDFEVFYRTSETLGKLPSGQRWFQMQQLRDAVNTCGPAVGYCLR
ncbi:MAG: aminopeptidase [Gammaproteobacteria bacterium]|nr:aminopeptidase [Gammaproteobacteria bacterium]